MACNLSHLLHLSSIRPEQKDKLRCESFLTDLLRLILLNPAEKLVEGKKDSEDDIKAQQVEKSNWSCCLMHCLQCLAVMSVEPLDEESTLSWEKIMASAESEVQTSLKVNRSSRMLLTNTPMDQAAQLSTVSVLNKYWKDGFNSGTSIAAKKIIDNLDLC